ncbi:hypothetical protein MMC06_004182 [Schaereria dolodes]|nr:hypothetical protein [Schaereria dolodes]
MSCPINLILNQKDASPRKRKNNSDEEPHKRQCHGKSSLTHTARSSKTATYGILPPVTFSPDKGALYQRRASKSPTRLPSFPTPPKSDQPTYWYDADPPSHELDFGNFSVFKALLNHPELTHEVTKYLHVDDLLSLYAISKDFHNLMNEHFTAMILAQSLGKAAESSRTFVFKCYKNLCIRDPAARKSTEIKDQVRLVPSFRWLRMILFREEVVDEIIACLAVEGHRLPKRTSLAIKKVWFTMDISDNARRIGIIHNTKFWMNIDLFLATMFFIKLDMRLTDPVDGNGEVGIRKMLLAQRSLSTLWKVLKRREMLTQLEMLQMFVRWKYQPAIQHRGMSIAGVPTREIGRGQIEGWGSGTKRILRPDELVMREGVKRRMGLGKRYLDMMVWGFIDRNTSTDLWPTSTPIGNDEEVSVSETEDETDQEEVMDYAELDLG